MMEDLAFVRALCELDRRLWVTGHEPIETVFGQLQQMRVTDGADGRRPVVAGQQRHLADALPARGLPYRLLAPVRAVDGGAEAPAEDDVQAVCNVPFVHERRAPGGVRELDLPLEVVERGLVENAEQGGSAEERDQFGRGDAASHDATTLCAHGVGVKGYGRATPLDARAVLA